MCQMLEYMAFLQRMPACTKSLLGVRSLSQVSQDQLGSFEPRALSNVIYGLAILQYSPSRRWMHCFLAATADKMSLFNEQGLSNLVWSLAKLGKAPDRTWLEAFLAALSPYMPHCSPQVGRTTHHPGPTPCRQSFRKILYFST